MSGQSDERIAGIRPSLVHVLVALEVIAVLTVVMQMVRFPFALDYGEAPLMDQAIRIARGEPLYPHRLDTPPYVVSNYTPLYPILLSAIAGMRPDQLLSSGRMLSVLGFVMAAVFLARWAHQVTKSQTVSWLAALFFLGNAAVAYWGALARVDMLALGFSLLGVWLVAASDRRASYSVLGLLALLAAVMTKQSYVLAATAAAIVHVYQHVKSLHKVIAYALGYVVGVTGLFATLELTTSGGFTLHTVIANANRVSAARALGIAWQMLKLWPTPILLSIAGMYMWATSQPGQPPPAGPRRLLPLAAYTCGGAITAAASGKIGSNINYWLELSAALSIWAAWATVSIGRRFTLTLSRSFILLHAVWTAVTIALIHQSVLAPQWQMLPQLHELQQQIAVAISEGPVLADERMDMVIMAGGRIYFQPFEMTRLWERGDWDEERLIVELKDHRFPLIVINLDDPLLVQERWPKPVLDTINRAYVGVASNRRWTLYRPRQNRH
ncbi:MAG: hypothetical protein Kow0047_02170 [Anaerolineae bacterium]